MHTGLDDKNESERWFISNHTFLKSKPYWVFPFFFETLQQQLLDKDPIFQNFFNLFLLPRLLKKVWQLKRISLQTKTLVLFFQKNKIRNYYYLCSAVFSIHMSTKISHTFVFYNIKGHEVLVYVTLKFFLSTVLVQFYSNFQGLTAPWIGSKLWNFH